MTARDGSTAVGWTVFLASLAALSCLAAEDVAFRDAGEIGAAAYGLGVAHPTGFAFDLLVLRAFAYLPLGSIAWRQNLAVAWQAAAALGLLAYVCCRLLRMLGIEHLAARQAGAVVAASGLAGWLTFVATARSVEVYSLGLLAVLVMAAGLVAGRRTSMATCCVVLGFSLGMHVTVGVFALLVLAASVAQRDLPGALRALAVRSPVIVAGALIVAYLPLASLRQPALDWGDPETLANLLSHLTAARIRNAYQAEMLGVGTPSALLIFDQLAELWPLFPLALLALWFGLRGPSRLCVLGPLAFFAVDLAYAATVNPMGAIDRQVGHVAGAALALLGGLGIGVLCDAVAKRAGTGWPVLALAAASSVLLLVRLPASELGDGYVASELYGSGGPLAQLPPRSALICRSDDECAGGLFASYVEAVRPDVDVLPAQHLWDPTVWRRLGRWPEMRKAPQDAPPPEQRARVADAALRWLLETEHWRPVVLTSADSASAVGMREALVLSSAVPYLQTRTTPAQPSVPAPAALTQLDALRVARLNSAGLQAERAQQGWSLAYDVIGQRALATDARTSLEAFGAAAEIAPWRAVAWTNLGVAQASTGDVAGAMASAEHAIQLAPERATAWVNLARLHLTRGDPAAAREVIELAQRVGVHDERLRALARQLESGR